MSAIEIEATERLYLVHLHHLQLECHPFLPRQPRCFEGEAQEEEVER